LAAWRDAVKHAIASAPSGFFVDGGVQSGLSDKFVHGDASDATWLTTMDFLGDFHGVGGLIEDGFNVHGHLGVDHARGGHWLVCEHEMVV